MLYYIRCPDGSRYKVREAVSLRAACNEIAHARVTGSIGGKSSSIDYKRGIPFNQQKERVIANVVQVNSDNTERQPYQPAY